MSYRISVTTGAPCVLRSTLALALGLAATAALAQSAGGLRVTVLDAAGDPLSGAVVVLRHDAGRLELQRALTDAGGIAEFPVLAAEGGWTLGVGEPGSERELARRAVGVAPEGLTAVTIRLPAEPASAGGLAYRALEPQSTAGVTRFAEDFVRALPLPGRFYQQALPIAAGVNDGNGDGNPRVHGATSRDFQAQVQGIANVDPFTGRFMSFVNSDSIDQIVVLASGASLEYGRAQGGFAAITQTIGANALAASAGLRYRSSDLDGDGPSADGSGDVEFETVQPSAMVSGPIVRDKLWYRLAWERLDQELPVDVTRGLAVQTRDQTLQAYQLTWQAAPRHRLALQYQTDPLELGGFGADSSVPLASSQRFDIESDTLSLVYTVPWSSRLLVESTLALQERSTRLAPEQAGVANDCVTGPPIFESSFCTVTSANRTSGSSFRTVDSDTDRWTLALRGTWQAGQLAGVDHRLRFGMVFEDESLERTLDLGVRSEVYAFELMSTLPLAPSQRGEVAGLNAAIYIEDSLRPARGLVLDVGLRLDREEIDLHGLSPFDPLAEAEAVQAALDEGSSTAFQDNLTRFDYEIYVQGLAAQFGLPPDVVAGSLGNVQRQSTFWDKGRVLTDIVLRNTNVSPSVAVSWDPWRSGRNTLAASARRYYGSLLLVAPLAEQEVATATLKYDLGRDASGDLEVDDPLQLGAPRIDATQVDHDLATPYQDEWRLAYERELWRENRLRVEYVNRRYRDQLQLTELNFANGDYGRCLMGTLVNPRNLIASPGNGFDVTDPYTGEVYTDTDPGDGDGRIDDCAGDLQLVGSSFVQRADGEPDAYHQNPAWGSVSRLTNDGRRDYEAFVLDFARRQFHGWNLQASYVWSMFEGSAEAYDPWLGPDRTRLENLAGAESDDQRHVFKLATSGVLSGDWQLGGIVTWQSGLPYSLVDHSLERVSFPPDYLTLGPSSVERQLIRYGTPERNTERNDAYWLFDVRVAKGIRLDGRSRLELSLDVFNLLDERPLQIYNPDTEIGLEFNGIASARRLYGRSYQLGLRLTFG